MTETVEIQAWLVWLLAALAGWTLASMLKRGR